MNPPLHSLPLFVRLQDRAVILVGEEEAAAPKRRLLERAGAVIVGEDDGGARLAIVADDEAAVMRLKARGVLVNAVDRPELCDFTLPAIVERTPVLLAIGTGGASAGLAAALRQRLETILPDGLGRVAAALDAGRASLRARFPEPAARRRAISAALAPEGPLDLLRDHPAPSAEQVGTAPMPRLERLVLRSGDPDDLTLRQARLLANADRVTHRADVPLVILDRARADAVRLCTQVQVTDETPGLTVDVEME